MTANMTAYNGVLGFNIKAQGVADWGRLYEWIRRLRPATVLIMDADNKRARELRQTFPEMTVILRIPYDGDSDYRRMTPETWMGYFAPSAVDGIVLQCLNEPQGHPTPTGDSTHLRELAQWCAQVMMLATARGIRVCVPNFAVGHPDTAHIERGTFDPILLNLRNHVLGLHEYAQTSAAETYRIGRYRAWLTRARELGVRRPEIVITETGRDIGGGYDDGWRGVLTDDQYATLLKNIARVYAVDRIPACIYGYGFNGDGRWNNFDVSFADDLLTRLVNERVPMNTSPPPPPDAPPDETPDAEWRDGYLQLPPGARALNFRTQPVKTPSTIMGTVRDNQPMRYRALNDDWYEVEVTTVRRGVVNALDGTITFTDTPDGATS